MLYEFVILRTYGKILYTELIYIIIKRNDKKELHMSK